MDREDKIRKACLLVYDIKYMDWLSDAQRLIGPDARYGYGLGWSDPMAARYLNTYYGKRVNGYRLVLSQMLETMSNKELDRFLEEIEARIKLSDLLYARHNKCHARAVQELSELTGRSWSEHTTIGGALDSLSPQTILEVLWKLQGEAHE